MMRRSLTSLSAKATPASSAAAISFGARWPTPRVTGLSPKSLSGWMSRAGTRVTAGWPGRSTALAMTVAAASATLACPASTVTASAMPREKDRPRHPLVAMPRTGSSEAMRAVAYVTAAAMDNAHRHPDAEARKRHQAFVDFMIPIVKGCSTETAQDVASLGVQVHGGMGYIEETRVNRAWRDSRLGSIGGGADEVMLMVLCKMMGILPGLKKGNA